jgi:hypothetical protein
MASRQQSEHQRLFRALDDGHPFGLVPLFDDSLELD